jgi:hypothetical protein
VWSSEPKREHTEPETFESNICDDQSTGFDRGGFEALAELCGPAPERIKRLLDDQDSVVGTLGEPRAVQRFTDKHEVTIRIELAGAIDCGLDAGLLA